MPIKRSSKPKAKVRTTARKAVGKTGRKAGRRWSQKVTDTSDALTLDKGVFKKTPRAIALSLKRSAEREPPPQVYALSLRDVDADILPQSWWQEFLGRAEEKT